ncbi:MAG: Chromosome segregation protein, ATPase [Myxococcaceae bacterium]|nr:Chromosome segregation protein, ATPase [Myxococcaceae bacterium]
MPALRWAFAALSVLLLLALAGAWVKDSFSEWRGIQSRYNALAQRAGKPAVPVMIRQIWKPELDVVDRCPTCHLTMGGAPPLPGDPLFAPHPPIPHEVSALGCTLCHGGQGRATTAAAAHGPTPDWPRPILDRPNVEAGCGGCHSGIKTPSPALAERGEQLIAQYECEGCHHPPGALDTIGLKGLSEDWHDRHAGRVSDGGVAFAPLADEDVPVVAAALSTRIGAPRLMAGKSLAARLGCRGCHLINGLGADEGPRLDDGPRRATVATAELAQWHQEHLLDPPRRVKDSRMPRLGLSAPEAELLTVFVLSLRAQALPEAWLPRDRVRTSRLGERDLATDGASLYAALCSACHGAAAEGRKFDTTAQAFPALSNPVFLALADDEFLRRSIRLGRPGRRMPTWGKPGGLSPKEIDALATHLRSLERPAPVFAALVPVDPLDRAQGGQLFTAECAPCHGLTGEGSALAPPLAAKDNEVTTTDERIHGTLAAGVAGTAMGSFRTLEPRQLRAIITTVRELPRLELSRARWVPRVGDPVRGAALYPEHCARCHEPEKGKAEAKGPGLLGRPFLSVASDGYLAGTIIRGRPGTEMPAFGAAGKEHARLEPDRVADLVAWLRSHGTFAPPANAGTPKSP